MALTFSVPDAELTATLANRRPEVVDNIFKGTPLLFAASRLGGTQPVDGGLGLVKNLMYAKSTAGGAFSDYDLLDTSPQNLETGAKFDDASYYETVSISFQEEKRNQGRHAVFSLWNQKIDDATMTLKDRVGAALTATQPAAGSKALVSLTELVDEAPSADPPRTAAIGGIGNSNTWWRNQATSGGAFSVADMTAMYNDVSDGSDFPSLLVTSSTVWEYYHNSQVGQIRYQDTRIADAGFPTLQFMNVPIVWEPQIGNTDEIYYINFKYYKFETFDGADFAATEVVKPDNQAARVGQYLWMGQATCSNRRRLGTLHGITAPA
jgi:hypothetical protein